MELALDENNIQKSPDLDFVSSLNRSVASSSLIHGTEKVVNIKGKEEVIIDIDSKWFYKYHLCKCGCGCMIECNKKHKYISVPKCIQHHHNKLLREKISSESRERWKSLKYRNLIILKRKEMWKIEDYKKKITLKRKEMWKNLTYRNNKIESMMGNKHFQYGKHRTEEERKKISKSLKGQFAGEKHPMFGKHHSEEIRNNISKKVKTALKNPITLLKMKKPKSEEHRKKIAEISPFQKGENHIFFNNWSSRLPYPQEWSKELKKYIAIRDNFTCQYCGEYVPFGINKGCPHHIDYDKNNCNQNNLVWVCKRCNAKFNSPKSKEYFKNLFQNKINQKVKTW